MNIQSALAAFGGALQAIRFIEQFLAAKQQSGEMTATEEEQWNQYRAQRMAMAHWKLTDN